jgi:hypothetical protein
MSKHTPGPWKATFEDYRWVIDCQGEFGPKKALAVTAGFYPKHEANARLIAAAPELLEALKMGYADTMDYIQRNHLSGAENNRWLVLARAAIARAEG